MVHTHNGPSHGHGSGANETRVGIAALLTGIFMLAEVAGGLISGSLALLADAGHMLADFAALGLAWLGFRLARRPADWQRTYGFDRFSVLVAFGNGLAMFVIAGWIIIEAARRLQEPVEVLGGVMLVIAVAGLAVNLIAFLILRSGDRANLNVRAAALHVAGDLLGSVAALAAAAIIMLTGWLPIDPILSVLVALIILRSAWAVVGDAGHILLEGAPATLDTRAIREDLREAVSGVIEVHHVHVWSITQERPMITLHARLHPAARPELVTSQIKARLRDQFHVFHATVEVEFDQCADQHVAARESG